MEDTKRSISCNKKISYWCKKKKKIPLE
jgi:hypothetical protein